MTIFRGWIIQTFRTKIYAILPGERLVGPFASENAAKVFIITQRKA